MTYRRKPTGTCETRSRRGGRRSGCPKPGHRTTQVGRAASGADGALVFAGSASLSPPSLSAGLWVTPCRGCPAHTAPRGHIAEQMGCVRGTSRAGKGCGRGTGVGPALAETPPVFARMCLTVLVWGLPLAGSPDFTLVLFLPGSPPSVLAYAWALALLTGLSRDSVVHQVGSTRSCVRAGPRPQSHLRKADSPVKSAGLLAFPRACPGQPARSGASTVSRLCLRAVGLDIHTGRDTLVGEGGPAAEAVGSSCMSFVWSWSWRLQSERKWGNQALTVPRSRGLAVSGKGRKEDSCPDPSSGSKRRMRRRQRRGSGAEPVAPQEQRGGPGGRGTRKKRRRLRAGAKVKGARCQELQTEQRPLQSRK